MLTNELKFLLNNFPKKVGGLNNAEPRFDGEKVTKFVLKDDSFIFDR